MKNLTAQAVYDADIYLRLSDDDGDKPESNSIKNQREFITEFLKSMPEIRIHAERKDDGFSGVDFFRPGIQEVLQDVRSGAVNCVVVKDLSRLGRNYIETGKVLQEFADHGVRFIAINDGYDTANAQGQASTILLPIKNLMNDSYSRDISVKIRSHLEVKKRKGQFVGAFAAYGYLKSPDDRNQLVVDDYAAEVVRDIFRWKLEGMSQQGIADRLNADGVLAATLDSLAVHFPNKEVMIVETAAYYSHENDRWAKSADEYSEFYPVSAEGQRIFTRELVAELRRHANVTGLFWWFPEENASGNTVTEGWLNRGLFDNHTGKVLPAYPKSSFSQRGKEPM